MIDTLEIRNSNRVLIGVIDNATSIIWHSKYYGTGDFEIYVVCNAETSAMLVAGNYVTRTDERDIGIIESVRITYTANEGRMIAASGRFAKSILDRRIIYSLSGYSVTARVLRGNVENAVRALITENAISCAFDTARNMPQLVLGASAGITKTIVDIDGNATEKQVTYKGLLEFIENLMQEYGIGSYIKLNPDTLKLEFYAFEGVDRSVDNTAGNEPITFSQDYDNILSSEYVKDVTTEKNTAIVAGEGDGVDRFVSVFKKGAVGISRREKYIDASSNSKTYRDEEEVEHTLTDAEYNKILLSAGKADIASYTITETFSGNIDLSNSVWKYGENADYYLGDIFSIQDNGIGLYINARLIGITETQDENGYTIAGEFGL